MVLKINFWDNIFIKMKLHFMNRIFLCVLFAVCVSVPLDLGAACCGRRTVVKKCSDSRRRVSSRRTRARRSKTVRSKRSGRDSSCSSKNPLTEHSTILQEHYAGKDKLKRMEEYSEIMKDYKKTALVKNRGNSSGSSLDDDLANYPFLLNNGQGDPDAQSKNVKKLNKIMNVLNTLFGKE